MTNVPAFAAAHRSGRCFCVPCMTHTYHSTRDEKISLLGSKSSNFHIQSSFSPNALQPALAACCRGHANLNDEKRSPPTGCADTSSTTATHDWLLKDVDLGLVIFRMSGSSLQPMFANRGGVKARSVCTHRKPIECFSVRYTCSVVTSQ